VREHRRQGVHEQVDGSRWPRRCRHDPSCSGDLTDVAGVAESSGVYRRGERFEVGLAGQLGVEGNETFRGVEQQRQSLVAALAGERDLRTEPLQPGAPELVEGAELGGGQ
jgi:hypothetical protein